MIYMRDDFYRQPAAGQQVSGSGENINGRFRFRFRERFMKIGLPSREVLGYNALCIFVWDSKKEKRNQTEQGFGRAVRKHNPWPGCFDTRTLSGKPGKRPSPDFKTGQHVVRIPIKGGTQ